MSDCIFCKIAAGEIPTELVYENDLVVAFDDISPQAPVHTLIIPKKHYDNISDGIDSDSLNAIFSAVGEVAKIKGIDKSGYRLTINTGKHAMQSVFHIHVHLLGGTQLNDGDPTK